MRRHLLALRWEMDKFGQTGTLPVSERCSPITPYASIMFRVISAMYVPWTM